MNAKRPPSHRFFRLLCLTLTALVALGLAACGGSDTPAQPSPTETPTGEPTATPTDAPASDPLKELLTTDQTGHPENSAATVDVEALLTVDPDYKTKEDYKVFFKESSVAGADAESYPHAVFHEQVTESGILVQAVTATKLNFLTIKEKDCWIFEDFRKQDTNQLRIALDDEATATYTGKNLSLHFLIYVSQEATFNIQYKNTAGEEVTASAKSGQKLSAWCELVVTLENPAFDGAYDGYDFYLTMKGPELIRVNTVWATDEVKATVYTTGLIESNYGESFYTVADVNVRSYGAAGDGRTDDTVAFKTAIDAVDKMGGGTVFVPAGYYCLTDKLTLPIGVGLVGELEQGTANGTVLMIYGGKGSSNTSDCAIAMNYQSCVMNIAFWYPEQTFVNGTAIPYPPTIMQIGSESVTVRNVTFVNSYIGLDYAHGGGNNSLKYTRDIYGTCLSVGYENDHSYDIGKIENFHLSPDYWLNSGLPGTPNADLLRTYMLRNSTGIILERIDWTYLADVYIDGYHYGVYTNDTGDGSCNGHMYNFNLTNCYYCMYCHNLSWMMISKSVMTTADDSDCAAIYMGSACSGNISLSNSRLVSEGDYAIVNQSSASTFTFNSSEITASGKEAYLNQFELPYLACNTDISDGNDVGIFHTSEEVPVDESDADYGRTVVTKPASTRFVNLQEAPYNAQKNTDISEILQKALDDMKETGGTLYLGAGTFYVNESIDVWAGIELRGANCWAQSTCHTQILTTYGEDAEDAETAPALINLYEGSGIRGICFNYPNQSDTANLHAYPFTIRGNGANIYVVDVAMSTAWNGVDFATNRCDSHYIEYLWATPVNITIQVGGGSENGIVRDCHFTPNVWALRSNANYWSEVFRYTMTQSKPFVVGECSNEILYHNFTYGAYEGLTLLDGAKNVFVLCHGVDSGEHSVALYGDAEVTMVDAQLVNLNGTGDMHYIVTDKDFTGEAKLINAAFWGPTAGAFSLKGNGTVDLYGGLLVNSGTTMLYQADGNFLMRGVILSEDKDNPIKLDENAKYILLEGNYFPRAIKLKDSSGAKIEGDDFTLYVK